MHVHVYTHIPTDKVFSLFKHYGLTVAGNDAMVSVVLSLANIAMGMSAAAFGVLLVLWGPSSWSEGIPDAHVLAGLCCFLLGHSVSSTRALLLICRCLQGTLPWSPDSSKNDQGGPRVNHAALASSLLQN